MNSSADPHHTLIKYLERGRDTPDNAEHAQCSALWTELQRLASRSMIADPDNRSEVFYFDLGVIMSRMYNSTAQAQQAHAQPAVAQHVVELPWPPTKGQTVFNTSTKRLQWVALITPEGFATANLEDAVADNACSGPTVQVWPTVSTWHPQSRWKDFTNPVEELMNSLNAISPPTAEQPLTTLGKTLPEPEPELAVSEHQQQQHSNLFIHISRKITNFFTRKSP